MIKKNKILQLLAILFAFTLITAACGDDDDSGSSASESSESAESTEDEVTLTQDGDSLLDTVKARGTLNCGVSGAAVAFSTLDPSGELCFTYSC